MNPPRLTEGPVSRGLARLTLPMVLGISSTLVAALFETFLLGLIGTSELAAYSFTFPVVGALGSISLGLSIGLSSVLARATGANDRQNTRQTASCGLLLTTLAMLSVSLVGFLTVESLFRALGAEGDILHLAVGYMLIWYASLIFFTLPSASVSALRAMGDARFSGFIMVAGAAMQMILDPILILGWFGVPRLGLSGAALAVAISRILLCVITFSIIFGRKELRERLIMVRGLTFSKTVSTWQRILTVGLPAMATNLIGPVSTAIIVSLLAGYGPAAVAGFGIASRLESISVIPLFALSASIGPFVGQNWGAGRQDRARQAMQKVFLWSVIWGALVAVLFAVFGPVLTRLFDGNPEVLQYANWYLWVVPVSYGTWGTLMMVTAIFNSLGRPLRSTCLSLLRMFGIYVPFALAGNYLFGVVGIFAASALANLLSGLAGYCWNRWTYPAREAAD